ncbi:hypothetical protein [Flavobacterium ajazii]|uniref:hypothetical protein n=1 Tax=Flavobacterium ajazii TaxID=2692318 RepID=UPI0013D7C3CC|nr:hypothetical protein [Flavobacterium ajazii]
MITKYSKKSLFIFVLVVQICFSQKTFKIKEGQLQFINADKGIIIKKGDLYYKLQLPNMNDYESLSEGFKYELDEVTLEEINEVKKDSGTIFSSDITEVDFKNLDTKKIITKNKSGEENYQLYKYNKNFLTIDFIKNSSQKPSKQFLMHYCFLDFGDHKRIILHDEGLIAPEKEKMLFLFKKNDLNKPFKNYITEKRNSLTPPEVFYTNRAEVQLNNGFYRTDTTWHKKLKIKDIYNQNVINKTFDSIAFNDFFIAGYRKGKINLYNYTFQNLNIENLKACSFIKHIPMMQIIEKNSLRRINLTGKDSKISDYNIEGTPFSVSFSDYFDSQKAEFKIIQEKESFYLEPYSISISSIVPNVRKFRKDLKLLNSNEFETVQFLDEVASITLLSEITGHSIQHPITIYTKLKNGKYNLTTIEYLIAENPSEEIVAFNDKLPKNLDSIQAIDEQTYLIEKAGLFTFYPITKEIKYKKLENFNENFARFELPNGQKGWLDLKGNEYLDN